MQITAEEQPQNNVNQKYQREVMSQGGQEKTFRILDEDGTDYGGSCIRRND